MLWGHGDADDSCFRASAFLSVVIVVNLVSVLTITGQLTGMRLFSAIGPPGIVGPGAFLIAYIAHYLAFGKAERRNEIVEEFEGHRSSAMAFGYYVYCYGSLILFFGGGAWLLART